MKETVDAVRCKKRSAESEKSCTQFMTSRAQCRAERDEIEGVGEWVACRPDYGWEGVFYFLFVYGAKD
jgi:hypothetical protein